MNRENNRLCLLDLLGRNTRTDKTQGRVSNAEREEGVKEEEQGKLGEDEETQEDTITRAEPMVDMLLGRREEDVSRGAEGRTGERERLGRRKWTPRGSLIRRK